MSDRGGRVDTTIAGRYRVTERAGTLLQADLYRGEHTDDGAPVMVLLLERQHVPTAEIVTAVVDELTEAKAGPQHPALIEVREAGALDDGGVYAVAAIEGVPATALIARAEAAPIEWPRLQAIIAGVLDGLVALHQAGRTHGAVGPELVFASGDGARLFPVSFRSLREADAPTAPGLVMSAPEYMAPEQVMGQETDARTDLYQVGCLVHALITGQPPFRGDTAIAAMMQHVSGAIPELPAERLPTEPDLAAIVRRLLDKRPENRFGSAAEVRDALGAAGPPAPSPDDQPALTALEPVGGGTARTFDKDVVRIGRREDGVDLEAEGVEEGHYLDLIRQERGGWIASEVGRSGDEPYRSTGRRPLAAGDRITVGTSTWIVRAAPRPHPGPVPDELDLPVKTMYGPPPGGWDERGRTVPWMVIAVVILIAGALAVWLAR
jgi:hypothetical protein